MFSAVSPCLSFVSPHSSLQEISTVASEAWKKLFQNVSPFAIVLFLPVLPVVDAQK